MDRKGQVFFLHNKVQTIYETAQKLQELLPQVRVAVAHGQLKESELEKVMISFFKNEIDVLVTSTIIEAGVDVANANTMIVNNADQFGLSQLYQLRGRGGAKWSTGLLLPNGSTPQRNHRNSPGKT